MDKENVTNKTITFEKFLEENFVNDSFKKMSTEEINETVNRKGGEWLDYQMFLKKNKNKKMHIIRKEKENAHINN